MTSSSLVNSLISGRGMIHAASVNKILTKSATLSAMPSTFSIVRTSPFPQYCAVITAAPDVSPKMIRFRIK